MGVVKAGVLTLAVFTVAAVLVAALADEPTPTNDGGLVSTPVRAGAAPTATAPGAVVMKDLKFSPATLTVPVGATVTWTNEDPMGHTVTPTDAILWGTQGSGSDPDDWLQQGGTWAHTFTKPGTYTYYCIPHASKSSDGSYRGMTGTIVVTEAGQAAPSTGGTTAFSMPNASVVPDPRAPARLQPGPDGVVHVELETREVTAKLADGVAYGYWTFNGTTPGPMVRIREGDTVEVTLRNADDSAMTHSVDFHAVTGPGGGAKATQTQPGHSTHFRFKALDPGLYVYHCATPHIPSHVANGMFGLILVEPKEGLPPVDREYFVVESEVYTTGERGEQGLQTLSLEKLQQETPDYFVFNGQVGALAGDGALKANVGETVRIYFGVGGGKASSFHVIGEVFDDVYMDGNGAATHNRQTVLVPAAGSAIFDFKVEYPGDYILVDHTLTRALDGGAVGILHVDGAADPSVFEGATTPGSGH